MVCGTSEEYKPLRIGRDLIFVFVCVCVCAHGRERKYIAGSFVLIHGLNSMLVS